MYAACQPHVPCTPGSWPCHSLGILSEEGTFLIATPAKLPTSLVLFKPLPTAVSSIPPTSTTRLPRRSAAQAANPATCVVPDVLVAALKNKRKQVKFVLMSYCFTPNTTSCHQHRHTHSPSRSFQDPAPVTRGHVSHARRPGPAGPRLAHAAPHGTTLRRARPHLSLYGVRYGPRFLKNLCHPVDPARPFQRPARCPSSFRVSFIPIFKDDLRPQRCGRPTPRHWLHGTCTSPSCMGLCAERWGRGHRSGAHAPGAGSPRVGLHPTR